jgi:Na+-translocating ferredoxin:NAD+ oxidoreductase RnfG subunit
MPLPDIRRDRVATESAQACSFLGGLRKKSIATEDTHINCQKEEQQPITEQEQQEVEVKRQGQDFQIYTQAVISPHADTSFSRACCRTA